MTKYRVLLLSQQPGVGGAERLVLGALSRADDLNVTVVAPPSQCELASSLGLEAIEADLPRIQTPFIGIARLWTRAVRLRKLSKQLKTQVLYANASRAMGYGLAVRMLGGPSLLVHNHHLLGPGDITGVKGHMGGRSRFVRMIDRWADLIVVPSQAASRGFERSEKIRVIPNGVDTQRFRPPQDKTGAKELVGIPGADFVVGTVTRADPEKGMGAFIDLAESWTLSRTTFLLGGGPSFPHERSYFDEIKARAATMGSRVKITGPLEDSVHAYQAMDVMVHLSELPETFGLTVAEAMACKVPVVAYRWGGLPEVVEDGKTGMLVEPLDVSAARHRVEAIYRAQAIGIDLGRKARAAALERFSMDRFVKELSSAIQSM